LESLESRGLVEVTLDRPRRYAARAIDEAFDIILGEKQAEIETIETIRKRLLQSFARIGGGSRETPSVRLQVIKGRAQVYKTLRRLVAGARKEVLSFTTTRGLQRSYRAGVNDVLLEAMGRGVKPRFIAEIDKGNRALMERIAAHAPLRHLDRQHARFVLFDRDSILTFLIQDERTIRGDAETALWTNSPDFVRAHLEFFEKSWEAGTRAGERLAELRKE
jgi:sugar-specific transcriptional regulator TrmB